MGKKKKENAVEDIGIVTWDKEVAVGAPTLGANLSVQQKGKLKGLFDCYGHVMSGIPWKTNLVSHTNCRHSTASEIDGPIQGMPSLSRLHEGGDGIIEESRSGWQKRGRTPVVSVKKSVDYRKLNALTSIFTLCLEWMRCWTNHVIHVRNVLGRLRVAGLTAKPERCQIGMKRCTYLVM